MIIEVIDANSPDFPSGSEHNFSDFIVWLQNGMLPTHFVFICFGKYWRVEDTCVANETERYTAPQFALYRGRLGVTEEEETKARVLCYIATHGESRYIQIAKALGLGISGVGYHVADLKARGLVETDPLILTEMGEQAYALLKGDV